MKSVQEKEITIFDIDSVVLKTILERTACLLVGPQGVGKTSSVYRVVDTIKKSSGQNVSVIEFNLSDDRNKELFEMLEKRVAYNSLCGILVFLFDEVEKKKSLIENIEKLIQKSKFPIIITSNDEDVSIKGAQKYRVKPPTRAQIKQLIKKAYGIDVPYEMIVNGDIRATLLRVKTMSSSYYDESEEKKIREIALGKRFYLEDVYNNEYWIKLLNEIIDVSKDDMKLAFNLIHFSKIHQYRGRRLCLLSPNIFR